METEIKNNYFDWEALDIVLSGLSSLDAQTFMGPFADKSHVEDFLVNYGFDPNNPIDNAELFGIFQEALQFIKRFFLKDANPDEGLDLTIPELFYSITDISEVILIACGLNQDDLKDEEKTWAAIILKVMHTILHTDKDLRYHYFSTIQTQIFDRFYKFLSRDEDDKLFLKNEVTGDKIELVEFETKSKKSRESIIIKLLHKKANVAEELFDRIGLRLITKTRLDTLKAVQFLKDNNIIIPNNIKPSRSVNTMFNFEELKALDSLESIEEELLKNISDTQNDNEHSSDDYRAIHFTCRQLIKYQNPFLKEFNGIRKLATAGEKSELTEKILNIDTKLIAQSIRFFYPFEVQITDITSHKENTEGDASHNDYKKSQLISARDRLFKPLLKLLEKL